MLGCDYDRAGKQRVTLAWWDKRFTKSEVSGSWIEGAYCDVYEDRWEPMRVDFRPTHWRPLPTPPHKGERGMTEQHIPPKSFEWLKYLHENGPAKPTGRSRSPCWCRTNGYTSWVYVHPSGKTATREELEAQFETHPYWFIAARDAGWSTKGQIETLTSKGRTLFPADKDD